jgi:hypothetical protein
VLVIGTNGWRTKRVSRCDRDFHFGAKAEPLRLSDEYQHVQSIGAVPCRPRQRGAADQPFDVWPSSLSIAVNTTTSPDTLGNDDRHRRECERRNYGGGAQSVQVAAMIGALGGAAELWELFTDLGAGVALICDS